MLQQCGGNHPWNDFDIFDEEGKGFDSHFVLGCMLILFIM